MTLRAVASNAVEEHLRAMLDLCIEGVGVDIGNGGWASPRHDLV
jgi:hypothetical protein